MPTIDTDVSYLAVKVFTVGRDQLCYPIARQNSTTSATGLNRASCPPAVTEFSSFEKGFERLAKVATTPGDGGTHSLPAGHQAQASTWKLSGESAPSPLESGVTCTQRCLTFRSGPTPGPGRMRSSSDPPLATRRSHMATHALIGTSACTPDAARRHQGGQVQGDGDGGRSSGEGWPRSLGR